MLLPSKQATETDYVHEVQYEFASLTVLLLKKILQARWAVTRGPQSSTFFIRSFTLKRCIRSRLAKSWLLEAAKDAFALLTFLFLDLL